MAEPSTSNKPEDLFRKYISERKVLIADSTNAARTGLAKTLVDMGAKANYIFLASSYVIAHDELGKKPYDLVVCDYTLQGGCGLDLIQEQRTQLPDAKKRLFFLVTSNTSQSAVAQAAEEDVDMFILKPYTVENLRRCIMKSALDKVNPSEYRKKIDSGKAKLESNHIDDAVKDFQEATKLDPKPALAHFYLGFADKMKKMLEGAEKHFDEGLNHSKIHYKCMTGLFDVYSEQQRHKEAYEIVKKLARYFPANPNRLSSVLRLAITTKSYEDIERYYQIFTSLEARDESLIKYICAALVVCGKFYLQQKHNGRALELFEKAAVTAAGKTKILREIIVTLTQFDMGKDAEKFLTRFPENAKSGEDYLTCQFLVSNLVGGLNTTIEKGRQYVQAGFKDSLLYLLLVKKCVEAELDDYAEELVRKSIALWPEQKEAFEKAIPTEAKETEA